MIFCVGHSQRCRIANGGPKFALDTSLRGKVDLLEELRRDGEAASCLDLSECIISALLSFQIVIRAAIVLNWSFLDVRHGEDTKAVCCIDVSLEEGCLVSRKEVLNKMPYTLLGKGWRGYRPIQCLSNKRSPGSNQIRCLVGHYIYPTFSKAVYLVEGKV